MEPEDHTKMGDFRMGSTVDWDWIVLLVLAAAVVIVALVTGAIGGSDHHFVDCPGGLRVERAETWEPTLREVRELCAVR